MGTVFTVYAIYPESPEDVEKIKEKIRDVIPEQAELADMKEEPLAFGLKVIKIGVKCPDKVGGVVDKLEAGLKNIPGVQNIEVEATTLL